VTTNAPSPSTAAPSVTDEAIADLRAAFRGQVLRPGDDGYDLARRVWNAMIDKRPAAIACCTGTADAVAAVRFARAHGLMIAVRGAGHNVAGNAVCDGGLVVDLSAMKGIRVDPDARIAQVQPGANWGDLDQATQLFGLATPGGEVSMTGIAGYTLTGGMGSLQRKWGLACDNLRSAEVVTADGEVLRASEDEHPDLLWALRGGGGNFGVVTWFEYDLFPVGPEVYSAYILYPPSEAPQIFRGWREFAAGAPDEVTSQVLFWGFPPLPDLPAEMHGAPVVGVAGLYAGPVADGERALAPLLTWGTPLADFSGIGTYVATQSGADEFFPPTQRYYWKSLYLDALDDAIMDRIIAMAATRPSPQTLMVLRHLGGAVRRLADDATAYGHRRSEFNLSLDATWEDAADDERMIDWTRRAWQDLRDATGGGVYLNFAGLGEDNEALARAGYGPNYDRLRVVKRRYDPENVFHGNVNIVP
jgi:FAD/FMN-containing dehydrogenase